MQLASSMARRRVAALFAIALAVLGGAALFTGAGVLFESGVRSHLPPGRLAGADVVVTARQSLPVPGDVSVPLPERAVVPASVVSQLRDVPGVESVVGDVSLPAAVVAPGGRVVSTEDPASAGHGWSSAALLGRVAVQGRAPVGNGEVALGSSLAAATRLAVGDRARLVIAGRSGSYVVTAVVGSPHAGVLLADATALRLAGRESGVRAGTVDLVGVRAAPGRSSEVADEVRSRLAGSGLVASTGASRGDAASPAAAASRGLLLAAAGSLSGIVLLVVGLIVAGALSVAVEGQRRELALLRAVGATPRQVRSLAAGQASVAAAVGAVPGIVLGYAVAGQLRGLLTGLGLPPEMPLARSPLPALCALLLLGATVQVAARAASRRTSRMSAVEAVLESHSEPREVSRVRVVSGLVLFGGALVLSVAPLLMRSALGAGMTSLAGIIASIGLALAGPALLQRLGALLGPRSQRRASSPLWLAVENVRAFAVRSAGVVSTLAMAVVLVLTYVLAQTTVMAAVERESSAGSLAQHEVSAGALGGVPDGLVEQLRTIPGVKAASAVSSTTVLWPHTVLGDVEVEPEPAMVLEPDTWDVLDLGVRAGDVADLHGATVAVSEDVARSRNAGVGRDVALLLGDGASVQARVVAVYSRSLGFGSVVLSRDLAEGHTGLLADRVLVRTERSSRLAEAVDVQPGLALSSISSGSLPVPPEVKLNLVVILVLLGYVLMGIANKLVAATSQRRDELAALRLSGATSRQLRAMLRREASLLSVCAIGSGLAVAAVPLMLLGVGFLDRPWAAGPLWLLPAVVLVVVGSTFACIELPGRRVLRERPAYAV
nr:FtsX family ABC transporter permease [Motilibacter deserti]